MAQEVEGGAAVFRREGEYWTVEHGDTALRLCDSKGLGYLATLFANPNVELAAGDLVGGVSSGGGDAGEVLDGFPAEFRAGMAERAALLGDTEASSPSSWDAGLRPGRLHLLVTVAAQTREARDRRRGRTVPAEQAPHLPRRTAFVREHSRRRLLLRPRDRGAAGAGVRRAVRPIESAP